MYPVDTVKLRALAARTAQQGVVLVIALIVLVAMTLTGIGLMRSVDTNVQIAGNLAFRNAALGAADAGIEAARQWITTQSTDLLINDQLPGYYATWEDDAFNPTTFDWGTNGLLVGTDNNGNQIRYVVHRMCAESAKNVDETDCFKVAGDTSGSTKG